MFSRPDAFHDLHCSEPAEQPHDTRISRLDIVTRTARFPSETETHKDSSVGPRRLHWMAGAGVFLLLLAAYLLTHGGELYVSDGIIMYRTTEALATRHTIVIDPIPEHRWQVLEGRHGLYFSKYGLGQPLLATVPFLAGSSIREIILVPGAETVAQLYFVSLFNQVVTAATGALVFLLGVRLGYGIRLSVGLALAWGLTTMAWPYSKIFFSEPLFTACLVATALGLLAYRQTPGIERHAWLALGGLALGYSLLTRVSGITFVPLFLAYGVWASTAHREGRPVIRAFDRLRGGRADAAADPCSRHWLPSLTAAVVAFGLPFAACVSLLLWHNVARFGHPLDNGYSEETFSSPLLTGLAGLLISPGKSVFLYAPLTLLAVVAWRRFWRHQPATAALYGGVSLLALVQTAKWWAWWGGWSWGPRLLIPLLPFAILALGPLLMQARWARVAALPLAAAGFVVALLGALLNYNGPLIDLHDRFATISTEPAEPAMYYRPEFSPILEHARSFLAWEHVSVATFDLQRLGFTAVFQALFLAVLALLFIAGLALLARVHWTLRHERR